MGCVVVCGAAAGALDGAFAVALLAFGFAVAAALVVAVVSVVAGYAWALALAVAAAILPATWVTLRLVRYGSPAEVFRRHRRPVERPAALQAAPRQAALPVGSALMLEAPKRVIRGVVLDDVHERTEAR